MNEILIVVDDVIVIFLMRVHRPDVCRALCAVSASLFLPPLPAAQSATGLTQVNTLPLSLCGGAYCLEYRLDGQRFRAVVDTGSPCAKLAIHPQRRL